jgi:hypothetical protein
MKKEEYQAVGGFLLFTSLFLLNLHAIFKITEGSKLGYVLMEEICYERKASHKTC